MSIKIQEMKKVQLIADLIQARQSLLDAILSLPPARQDEVFLGVWSVKDLVAHLIGWDDANLEAAQSILANQLPAFYNHYDRDWKSFNARLVNEHRLDDFQSLLVSVKVSQQKLVDFLRHIPAAEFSKDRGVRFKGYKVTIGRLLEAETKDEKIHQGQVEDFKHPTNAS